MRHFLVFHYPEEPEQAPARPAGVARDGTDEENGSNEGRRMYNRWWPKRKSWYSGDMSFGVDPVGTDHRDRVYRVCLSLASVSFLFWLLNSYAISNTIHSVSRLIGKFPGR
jgi:hypothetical protein